MPLLSSMKNEIKIRVYPVLFAQVIFFFFSVSAVLRAAPLHNFFVSFFPEVERPISFFLLAFLSCKYCDYNFPRQYYFTRSNFRWGVGVGVF
jgi:hypothetical protein